MYYVPWRRRYQHVRRYREITQVLLKHGLGHLVEVLDLARFLSWPRRLLHRERPEGVPMTGPQRLLAAIEELGPTFIKLGQILSTRPDLVPPDYLAALSLLQDTVPPVPFADVREMVASELGAAPEEVYVSFDPTPVASASLGQVHRASLPDGERVVVKVQRPGIQAVINTDLEILFDLARLAQERTSLGENADLEEIAEDFAFTLRNELDYRREGRNADRFRHNFADEPTLYIPQVYWDYTTRRVLTLEEISGIKINDVAAMDAAGIDRKQVALNAAQIILKEVFEDGFFHADPHPGNFFVMPGEVIGAMDFGMVGRLDRRLRDDLLRLFIVAVRLDAEGVVDQLVRMGVIVGEVDRRRLARDIGRLLSRYYGLLLKDIRVAELVEEVTPLTFRYRLHFPSDLWLLAKTLAMMEGVGYQLDPDFNVFAVSLPYVESMVRELSSPWAWGGRALKGAEEMAEALLRLPEQWTRIVERIERGEVQVRVTHDDHQAEIAHWERMASRLGVSLVMAALIVSVAVLAPRVAVGGWEWLVPVLVGLGLASVVGLTFALLWLAWPRR